MSEALPSVKQWQRNRALLLHREFSELSLRVRSEGVFPTTEIKKLARKLKGTTVQAGLKVSRRSGIEKRLMKPLKLSAGTLLRYWYQWNSGKDGEYETCSTESLLLDYKAGIPRIPELLITEIQRRCTLKTGGRDKHGLAPISVVYDWLKNDFAEGKPIPGINIEDYPVGADFPYSESTIRSYAPAPAERALGNRGVAAFKARACHVTMDYSKLRKCELYTLDDARLDLLCIHDATGRAIIVRIYILMEVASRMIVSFLIKPMEAICQEDVEELLAHGLQTPGFGIGVGYTTYIKFERGATPCSPAAQEVLEKMTGDRIQVIRTGMNGGVTWIGASRDVASGNAAGKAVIESFVRRLHYALLHLPGQIGNNWQNTPASMGFGKRPKANPLALTKSDPRYGTMVVEAEKLAQFALAVRTASRSGTSGKRLKLQLPMLYLSQLQWAVHEAVDKLNHEPGHEYADHGEFVEAEVEPGVWKNVDDLPSWVPDSNRSDVAAGVAPAVNGKTYTLTAPAEPLTPQQRNGMYWRLFNAAKAEQPTLNAFGVITRALGRVKKIKDMTDTEFRKVCHIFESIAKKKDSRKDAEDAK